MSFGEYIKKMRKKKAWTLDRLANLVSREAENFFTNHGEQAYKGLTLSKYQLSHIENDSRQPDKEVLNLLIKVLEIKAFDLQELQKICQEFGIGNELPDSLKVLTPATQEIIRQQEITRQKGFTDIHIISDSPLEIMPISEENLFLLDFIKELQSPENNQNKYTYWTLESSINKFKILFSFMKKHGVDADSLRRIRVVTCPQEMCIFSCSIYSFSTTDKNGRTEKQIGRFLIREDDQKSSNFNLVNMGSIDTRKLYEFLTDVKSYLGTEYQPHGYEAYYFDEESGLEKICPKEILK